MAGISTQTVTSQIIKKLFKQCLYFFILTTNCSTFDTKTNCWLLKTAEHVIFSVANTVKTTFALFVKNR